MKKIKIVYFLILSLLLVGCAKDVNIEIFRFVNHENKIQVGDETNLQLIMGEYPEGSKVTYTLSEQDIISFVDGVAIGLKVGEVQVKATVDNIKFATTTVIVNREPVDALQILAPKDVIYIDETLQLDTLIFPSYFTKKVTWSIEIGSEVASISSTGLVSPNTDPEDLEKLVNGPLKVRVLATSEEDDNVVAKKDLYVSLYPTKIVTITAPDNKTEFTLSELTNVTSIELTVGKLPEKSYPFDGTFVSSDPTIATTEIVDGKYIVKFPTVLKAGKTTITVKTMDKVEGSITLTISEDPAI